MFLTPFITRGSQRCEGSLVSEGNAEVDREDSAALMGKHLERQTDKPPQRVEHRDLPVRRGMEANRRER